ncbi:MAG: DUF1559 domain-containing protein [Capsulimonadaceae bacterium]|nr:DUF1559 domain-containing protein [Capsulimonadaceae bacterium]
MRHIQDAFTLIELLIVIAIIAILAAILFPVFATAREKARQSTCISNLKQIGVAFTQYEQDYDEMTPCGSVNKAGWAGYIFPYVKSNAAFLCPDDTYVNANSAYQTESYCMNLWLNWAVPSGKQNAVSIVQMTAPASTVLICETYGGFFLRSNPIGEWSSMECDGRLVPGGGDTTVRDYRTGLLNNTPQSSATGEGDWQFTPTSGAHQQPAHSGGSIFLACDGHAKWLQGTKVSSGSPPDTSAAAQSWGKACGVNSMRDGNDNPVALTFSYL